MHLNKVNKSNFHWLNSTSPVSFVQLQRASTAHPYHNHQLRHCTCTPNQCVFIWLCVSLKERLNSKSTSKWSVEMLNCRNSIAEMALQKNKPEVVQFLEVICISSQMFLALSQEELLTLDFVLSVWPNIN